MTILETITSALLSVILSVIASIALVEMALAKGVSRLTEQRSIVRPIRRS